MQWKHKFFNVFNFYFRNFSVGYQVVHLERNIWTKCWQPKKLQIRLKGLLRSTSKSKYLSVIQVSVSFECYDPVGPGGGGTRLANGPGRDARFSENYPLHIAETSRHILFYDEFWRNIICF